MRFIFPISQKTRGKLLNFPRLYAYPNIPETQNRENIAILDSGAFALSKKNKIMDDEYLYNLSNYYNNNREKNTICVAPDKFLDPYQSMRTTKTWALNQYARVSPVIQFIKKAIDYRLIYYQLDFYLELLNEINTVLLSNPSLRACDYPKDLFIKIKEYAQIEYIHNLGAGWDLQDVYMYSRFVGLDSIDSISYYNDKIYEPLVMAIKYNNIMNKKS